VTLQGVSPSEIEYENRVQERIRQSLSRGHRSFGEIVRNCQGAYPTTVHNVLQRQADVRDRLGAMFELTHTNGPNPSPSTLDQIEGNPVLSSWYFTNETCRRLAQLRDWNETSIAFLGTPRLYDWFSRAGLGRRRLLLDLDALVIETLAETISDLGELRLYDAQNEISEDLEGRFQAVFLDPPWYPEDYVLWLRRAMRLAPGGFLCASLFPELTRPTASTERLMIRKEFADHSEFSIIVSDYLEYEIPSFEDHELAVAGLEAMVPWKLSDLLLCCVKRQLPVPSIAHSIDRQHQWKEIDIGSLRLFVDLSKSTASSTPFLTCGVDNMEILPSPSRRNPALASVNVLSSRGHGLACALPEQLFALLERVRDASIAHRPLNTTIDSFDIDTPSQRLLKTVILGGHNE
jgi:hypothetical protein